MTRAAKQNCRYCFGRGYELWVTGYTVDANGDRVSQTQQRDCRCLVRQPTAQEQKFAPKMRMQTFVQSLYQKIHGAKEN